MNITNIIKIAINSSENLSKEKRNECIEYINTLQKENARLKDKIEKLNDYVEDRISALTVSVDNKAKDEYFNNKCIGGVQELKNVKVILKEN